jgi:hypothetical protein
MQSCGFADCGWHALAPSRRAATRQFERHLLADHVEVVDDDVPAGTVKVRRDGDAEWTAVPVEDALGDD